MTRTPDPRGRAIRAAAHLFDQRGYHGVAVSEVIAASGAPKGSFYFHFPGGKEQLAAEAVAQAGQDVADLIERAARGGGPSRVLIERIIDDLAAWIGDADYSAGCAVSAVALDAASTSTVLRDECERQYSRWARQLAGHLGQRGTPPTQADAQAELVVAAVEGALLRCRTARSAEPLLTVGRLLVEAVS